MNEFLDEFAGQIGVSKESINSFTPLGIIFSGKFLYQPELIVLVVVNLSEACLGNLRKNENYKVIEESGLVVDESMNRNKYKDLYLPAKSLYLESIQNSENKPR